MLHAVLNAIAHYWPLVTTVVLPLVANILADCDMSGAQRGWIAAMLSVLVGVLTPLTAGLHLTVDTLSLFAVAAFAATTVAYHIFTRVKITNRWLEAALKLGSGLSKAPSAS